MAMKLHAPSAGLMQQWMSVHTSRQTKVTVWVVELPLWIEVAGLRWWLDIEKRSGMVISLLSTPK